MVAMAGDSYLLKVPTPPCQASHVCKRGPARSTSCGVVVSMVLLLAAVLALAAIAYHLRLELCTLRAEVHELDSGVARRMEYLSSRMSEVDEKLSRLNLLQDLKIFEAGDERQTSTAGTDLGTEDEDDGEGTDPVYDDQEYIFPVENRASDGAQNRPANVPKLEPAGSLVMPRRPEGIFPPADEDDDGMFDFPDSEEHTQRPETADHQRERREVASASTANRRGEPQLKLYHMLQTPSLAAAPAAAPAEPWSYHGSYRPDHYPQPMYAEHAPTDFVAPPRRYTADATPATPIASRRSRVMDAGNPHEPAPRQRHRNRAGRRQLQQQQQYGDSQLRFQDVSQDVSQDTGRSVEVRRYDEQRQQQQQQQRAAWRGHGSGSGGPYWRGARVTDSFHQQD